MRFRRRQRVPWSSASRSSTFRRRARSSACRPCARHRRAQALTGALRPARPTCSSSSPRARPCRPCSTASRASSRSTPRRRRSPRSCCSTATGMHLRHGAAPSLPPSYCEAIDGLAIGPNVGSCGTAAYRRERVVRLGHRERPALGGLPRARARAPGCGACWSTPIFATDGSLLGTFALYYREPHDVAHADVELVELATHVAGIAIERARSRRRRASSEERYRDLFENANEPIATVTMDESITEVNRAFERVLGYTRDGADRHEPRRLPDARRASRRRMRATERKLSGEVAGTTFEQEFIAKDGHSRDPRGVEPRDRGGRPADRRAGHLPRHHGAQAGRHRAAAALRAEPPPGAARQPHGPARTAPASGSRSSTPSASPTSDGSRARRAADGPRPLQGDQRHARPPLRRPAAASSSRGASSRSCAAATRSRASAATSSASSCGSCRESTRDLDQALERILAALEQPFLVDGLPLHVEASIGVARFPAHGRDVDLLLQRADVAMYLAKETGRAPRRLHRRARSARHGRA